MRNNSNFSSLKVKQHIWLLLIIFTFLACGKEKKHYTNSNSPFVRVEDGKFYERSERFYPIILNYLVSFQLTDNGIVLGPNPEYDSLKKMEGNSKEEVYGRIHAHFQLIKDIGFNTIRINSIDKLDYEKYFPSGAFYFFKRNFGREPLDKSLGFFSIDDKNIDVYKSIHEIVDIAEEVGLKLIITLPRPRSSSIYNETRITFLNKLFLELKEEPTIFAYDFFNEPLYFDNAEHTHFSDIKRSKKDAYRLVLSWRRLLSSLDCQQLMTISFAEPIEIFEWDPSILPIDFVSVHSYSPLRVPNEIYWYSKYLKKPWLVSETALPADGDSISYYEQLQFMMETLNRAENCNSQGFGWWQFQEVNWGHPEHNYTSLLNHEGVTVNSNGDTIYGSLKPAAIFMKDYKYEVKEDGECDEMVNYKNMLGFDNYLLKGRIIDKQTSDPVEGAVIRGWTPYWHAGANTYTDEDGNFELYSNDRLVHFTLSALGMNSVSFNAEYNYELIDDKRLMSPLNTRYEDLVFRKFLKPYGHLTEENISEEEPIIFQFEPSMFSNYKYRLEIPDLYLDSLGLNKELY